MDNRYNSENELERIEIELLLRGIYEWYGYDFRNYSYNSIRRRIWHRIGAERLTSISGLQERVLHDPQSVKRLVADFSINVTEMFRDPRFFLSFRRNVVPLLHTYPIIRVWLAGCSTGEEVYSMAILLHEEGLYNKSKIYATDMNMGALEQAKNGVFRIDDMKKYTKNYLEAGGENGFSDYYTAAADEVRFHEYLSERVVFAQHNLAVDRSFNEFHVIFCRNVLIYFDKFLKEKVFDLLYESLGTFGVLGLGDKETISFTNKADRYEPIDPLQKLYRKVN